MIVRVLICASNLCFLLVKELLIDCARLFNGVDNIPDKAPPAEENEAEAHVEEQDGVDSIPDKAPPAEETGAEALVEEQDGVDNISEKAPPVEETGAEASVEEREASEEQQNAKPKCKGGRKRERAAGSEDIDSTSVFQKLLVVKRSEAVGRTK